MVAYLVLHDSEHGSDISESYWDVPLTNSCASATDDSTVIGGIVVVIRESAEKMGSIAAGRGPATESAES